MDYKTMRNQIEDMVSDNHKDFVKAVISMEKGINDESALDKLYEAYMDNDTVNLLHEEFDYMIEDLREQGQIKDLPYVQEEKDNLVNIVGNIVGKIDVVERENKNGEAFQVVNFSVASKDDEGNKVYHNCSAYGEKGDIPKDFKQGDFVKLFGQIRTSVDDNGKEHTNIRILSSKLLKAKEQMRGQEEKKESVLGAIKKYQAEDKEKPKEKKEIIIPTEKEVKMLLEASKNTNIEIPIILAALCGLRQSEIAACTWDKVNGNILKVKGAIVPNRENKLTNKATNKSYSGTRDIILIDYAAERLSILKGNKKEGTMSTMIPSSVLRALKHLCRSLHIPEYTMHSLRHYHASVMLSINIPDKYAMKILGQNSPYMLKTTYQHIFSEEYLKVNAKINDHYSDLS